MAYTTENLRKHFTMDRTRNDVGWQTTIKIIEYDSGLVTVNGLPVAGPEDAHKYGLAIGALSQFGNLFFHDAKSERDGIETPCVLGRIKINGGTHRRVKKEHSPAVPDADHLADS